LEEELRGLSASLATLFHALETPSISAFDGGRWMELKLDFRVDFPASLVIETPSNISSNALRSGTKCLKNGIILEGVFQGITKPTHALWPVDDHSGLTL
jgi:hypothetical protein